MWTSAMGVMLAGVLVVAGTAIAQTAGPTLGPVSRGIVPVTGPSTAPSVLEPAGPEVTPAVARGTEVNGEGARKGPAARPPAATAARQAPPTVKAMHRLPAEKGTVKKASPARHVAKGAGSAKTRHVAAARHRTATHQAAAGKAVPVTKHQPRSKNAAPRQPVLPRV